MTADELLTIARRDRPTIRYTRNKQGTAIAAWCSNRWCMVAGLLLDGTWATIGDLFVNGEPLNKVTDWIPE